MSVTSRILYRSAYRCSALNSLAFVETVRSRHDFRRTHRHRTFPRIASALRTVRTVPSIDRKKIKDIGLGFGRYGQRYGAGTAGRCA